MARMANAASQQGLEVFKERLRAFLENTEAGRQAVAMSGRDSAGDEGIRLNRLNGDGKRAAASADEDDLDDI